MKNALVTGASGGIGTAVCAELLRANWKVYAGSRAQTRKPWIRGDFPSLQLFEDDIDVCNSESVEAWVRSAGEREGKIDAVINCVGIRSSYNITDDLTDLDSVIDTNVKGPIRVLRQSIDYLRVSENPKVINLVSLSGLRITGRSAGYAVSKFALRAVTDSFRNMVWDDGIRVTSLCPGLVNTGMVSDVSSVRGEEMTQPEDIGKIVGLLLDLPRTCSISQVALNCQLETIG